MRRNRQDTIKATTELLNLCRQNCYNKNFDPKTYSRRLKTSNTTFYTAVEMEWFTKVRPGIYDCNKIEFIDKDSEFLLGYSSRKQQIMKKIRKERAKDKTIDTTEPLLPILTDALIIQSFDFKVIIDELSRRGYNGIIEMKNKVVF